MPEITSFPIPPNIKAGELTGTVARLAEFLQSSAPDQRGLRKTLRQWKIWDKEKTPAFLDFLKVHASDESVGPGPFLSHYLSIVDETERRTLIFQFLKDQNPILVKSIFDSLDTERDGRIQSTNELYRMITSYIYPGEYISLPDFQRWVTWMDGVDVLQTIGLRWGFGAVGSVFLEEIRQMDMEEILEDLEDGLPSTWDEMTPSLPQATTTAEPSDEPVEAAQAAPSAKKDKSQPKASTKNPKRGANGSKAKTKSAAAEPTTEAPSPPRQTQETVQNTSTAPEPEALRDKPAPKRTKPRGVNASSPPPAPTLPVLLAPIFVRGGTQTMVSLSEKDITANAESIHSWWETYSFRAPYRAKDFGLELEGKDEDQHTLAHLCVAALFAHRAEGSAAACTAHRALQASGALEGWITGSTTLEESIKTLGLLPLVGGDSRFLDILPQIIQVCAALQGQPQRIADWGPEPPESTVRSLHVEVFGRVSPLAPFWVIRESLLAKLIDEPIYERVATVPTRSAREHGYRLGFLDGLYAEGMEDLLTAAAKLHRFFGEQCEYNAPLEFLHDQLGCRFRCPSASGCSYNCREKTAL